MNRSRETMQFIQALSAPTRASSSATSSTKNYWLSFRLYQRHLSIVYRSPSHPLLPIPMRISTQPIRQSIRNLSIFFLLSLSNPLNIVAPFFRTCRGREDRSRRRRPRPFVEVDSSRMSDEKPVNRGIFQRKIETRGVGWLLII